MSLRRLLPIVMTGAIAFWISSNVQASGIQPPWSRPMVHGVNATVPGVDNAPDFHGDINKPQLVIFFAGNQYMLVNRLLMAFQKADPEYRRIFAETLPPGILARQIRKGALVMGNMRVTLKPDIFTAGHGSVMALQQKHQWFSSIRNYARNRLAILTYLGNPYHISSWRDLARPGLPICMPNPKWEGIARHAIIPALRATGGEALVRRIYTEKVRKGGTYLTHIHHRQTPLRIMEHKCDAGAVWYTEAYFQADIVQHPVSFVRIKPKQNHFVTYAAAIMRNAPHRRAAEAFLRFLTGPKGQAIYHHYGFLPAR